MTANAPTIEPVVQLTENAAQQIKHLLASEQEGPAKALRLYVEKGGCSGLKYSMTFDQPRDGDARTELSGASVVVDSFSATYLRGCQLDYADTLTDGGFKITNPNAKQSCGCGKSFEAAGA